MSQSDEMQYATAEVSAELAYEAAVERAARTQHALILAEAQITAWKQRYADLLAQLNVTGEDHWRPTDRGPAEFVCPHKEVNDATEDQDPAGYAGAVGQAD